MNTAQTKWVAGWPIGSWFGFAGAVFAALAVLLDRMERGVTSWGTVAVGVVCVVIALIVHKKAKEI